VPGGSSPADGSSTPSAAGAGVAEPAAFPSGSEGLPEWEPLTPELVADEALRGDFMLRWAAILLALLLGWTEISDTATLVRICAGEYIASHGGMPPATDPFSYTATDRPWVNLSWLSDVLLAGMHALGGPTGLSLLSAVLSAAAFWFVVNASRTGVSTWWGSVCAAVALVAAFPLLTAGPDVFTVLGLAVTLFALQRSEDMPASRWLWALPPVYWLWSNLDRCAFLGLAVLCLYAVGRTLGGPASEEDSSGPSSRKLWTVFLCAVVAVAVHPFHWHALAAPWELHLVEYPELRAYWSGPTVGEFPGLWLSYTEAEFWERLDGFGAAGVLIAGVALVTMLLNVRRLDWSWAFVWLGMNGLAAATGHQLAAAAVVNAVIATLNGQDWYRANFRQSYSIEVAELLYSRAGRALSVIGLFLLGYWAVSGRLMGADGRRIGVGFAHDITATIESFRDVLGDSYDDRPFNFRLEQGDVLVWLGQKPFIDSRVSLYAGAEPNLARLHRDLRPALRQPNASDPLSGRPEFWKQHFDQYQVTHVLPRLGGLRPDYPTLRDLLVTPQWVLAKLGAATAALYRTDSTEAAYTSYVGSRTGVDFRRLAFPAALSDDGMAAGLQPAWPQPQSFTDRFLMLRKPEVPNSIQMARHFDALRELLGPLYPPGQSAQQSAALALLSIREARRGLAEQPDSLEAWRTLARAYGYLNGLDTTVQQSFGVDLANPLRYRQQLSALWLASACDPRDADVRLALFQVLIASQKLDLALKQIQEYERLTGDLPTASTDAAAQESDRERMEEELGRLSQHVNDVRERVAAELTLGSSRLQVAQLALQERCPGIALEVLDQDPTVLSRQLPAQLRYAELLLDAGRIEEAWEQTQGLESLASGADAPGGVDWRTTAALTNAVSGGYAHAAELWQREAESRTASRVGSLIGISPAGAPTAGLNTVPLVHSIPDMLDGRPLSRSILAFDVLMSHPAQWSLAQFNRAMAQLERGNSATAAGVLRNVLDSDPETPLRPVVGWYLSLLTGESIDLLPPSEHIPIRGDMFAPDESE
jgi:tetratricopeptide (TPR) repeat protein